MLDSKIIRRELAKLKKMPPWGRKQGNRWDQLSNFIYRTETLNEVWQQVNEVAKRDRLDVTEFGAYAVRRWYNFHTHNQILQIILNHPDVQPEQDRTHRTIDFYLRGIPFDLKISRFPKAYPQSIAYARQNPHHLAHWQYENQSRQGRYHTGNRLFMVLYPRQHPELTWQLRRDFETLEPLVQGFLAEPTLLGLTVTDYYTGQIYRPWAALIFVTK